MVERKSRGVSLEETPEALFYLLTEGVKVLELPEWLEKGDTYTLEVIAPPIGPPPERVRNAWVGTKIEGARRIPDKVGEYNFMTGEPLPGRDNKLAVSVTAALQGLAERGTKDALFAVNWWLNYGTDWLSFGEDEVRVIDKQVGQ